MVCEELKYRGIRHTTVLNITASVLSFSLVTASEPCVFGPYSITDVYAQDEVQITFTPLYVTYSVRRDSVSELAN